MFGMQPFRKTIIRSSEQWSLRSIAMNSEHIIFLQIFTTETQRIAYELIFSQKMQKFRNVLMWMEQVYLEY